MMHMYGYIYLTTNLINGKKYIGKHRSEIFDEGYKGSGILIQRALNKYGFDNFECKILCECCDDKELNEQEKYYISLFNAVEDENFYNIAPGGQGGDLNSGRVFSEEHNRKISIANTGKVRSDERRKEQSALMIGNNFYTYVDPNNRKWSDERIKLMSEKFSGEGNPMYGKDAWNKGVPKTQEEKEYLSKIRKERNIPSPTKGKKAMHKDGKTVYVSPNEIDEYILNGYELHGAKRNRGKTKEEKLNAE